MSSIRELAMSRARFRRVRDNINEFPETLDRYLDQRPAKPKVGAENSVKYIGHRLRMCGTYGPGIDRIGSLFAPLLIEVEQH